MRTLRCSLDEPFPFVTPAVPKTLGQEPVHTNTITRNRALAGRLWRMISRNPSRFQPDGFKNIGTKICESRR